MKVFKALSTIICSIIMSIAEFAIALRNWAHTFEEWSKNVRIEQEIEMKKDRENLIEKCKKNGMTEKEINEIIEKIETDSPRSIQ